METMSSSSLDIDVILPVAKIKPVAVFVQIEADLFLSNFRSKHYCVEKDTVEFSYQHDVAGGADHSLHRNRFYYGQKLVKNDTLSGPDVSCTSEAFRQKISNTLGNLVCNKTREQWSVRNEKVRSNSTNMEKHLSLGFLCKMYKSTGREAIAGVLSSLFEDAKLPRVLVRNVGGSSTKDPSVRKIIFHYQLINTPPSESNADCNPEKADPKYPGLRVEGSPPKLRNPPAQHSLQLPVDSTKEKYFVPDLIVQFEPESSEIKDFKELLIVSIKSGAKIKDRDRMQLNYQVMPAVLHTSRVLGLIICAWQAELMEYTLENEEIEVKAKQFNFTKDNFAESFNEMCNYLVHFVQELVKQEIC